MPNRYIKESIWTSPNLNNCSDLAEMHFYRILLSTDDWGCLEITPLVVKGKCYPRKKHITEDNIENWNKELIDNAVIREWTINDRQYAMFIKFDEHNDGLDKNDPRTPCPPWIMRSDGIDPRLSDKTSDAFNRIEQAIKELSHNGHKPSQLEIAQTARSSKSTVVKYFKKNTPSTGGTHA